MQLLLIFGIGFAIAAVAFALQNNIPVTVSFAFWSFEGSLAIVLLMAVGLGALIAGLVSSPAMIKGQWSGVRSRRQLAELEKEKAAQGQRIRDLEQQLDKLHLQLQIVPEQPKPYVGLKTLLTAGDQPESKPQDDGVERLT